MYRNRYASSRKWAYDSDSTAPSSAGVTKSFDITGWGDSDDGAIRLVTNNTVNTLPEVHATNAMDPEILAGGKQTPVFTSASTIQSTADWPDAGWLVTHSAAESGLEGRKVFSPSGGWYTTGFSANGGGSTGNRSIVITYPFSVQLRRMTFTAPVSNQQPKDFYVEGSNDNSNWTVTDFISGLGDAGGAEVPIQLEGGCFYMYWRIRVTRIIRTSSDGVFIVSMKLFTGWSPASISIGSVKPLIGNPPTFIDLFLRRFNGEAVDVRTAPLDAIWAFNIILTQGGQLVNFGR
jgi:hypothetical protein